MEEGLEKSGAKEGQWGRKPSLLGLKLSKGSIFRALSEYFHLKYLKNTSNIFLQLDVRVLEMFWIIILGNHIPNIVKMCFETPKFL